MEQPLRLSWLLFQRSGSGVGWGKDRVEEEGRTLSGAVNLEF